MLARNGESFTAKRVWDWKEEEEEEKVEGGGGGGLDKEYRGNKIPYVYISKMLSHHT